MGDSLFFALKRLWDSTGGWTVAIMDCTGLRLNASSILSKSVKTICEKLHKWTLKTPASWLTVIRVISSRHASDLAASG